MGWSPISHRAIRADRCWHGCLCRARCPGLGGFAAFFAYSALLTLAIILIALAVISFFAGGNLSPGVREDRGNRWVLIAFALIGFLDGYLPAYTDRVHFRILDGDGVRWLGVGLFAAGVAL